MSMTPSRQAVEAITLAGLAADNRLFVVRCNLCRKTDHYLASDLAKVYGGDRPARSMFTRCKYCQNPRWLHVSYRFPTPDDIGRLHVIRPFKRTTVIWKDAIYNEPDL